MASNVENDKEVIPQSIVDIASEACSSILPKKSEYSYKFAYRQFSEWKMKKNVNLTNETVIVAYFAEKVNYLLKFFIIFVLYL